MKLSEWEMRVMQKNFQNACDARMKTDSTLDTIFLIIDYINNDPQKNAVNTSKYILKYDAFYDYLDYLEFQEARKSSKSAKRWAIFAILLNVIAIFVQIYTSESNKIDEKQFIEIKNIISSEVKK